MRRFSAETARAAVAKQAGKKEKRKEAPSATTGIKAAVAKRPCTGVSIGAPAAAAKTVVAEHPRPPTAQPTDKGKQTAVAAATRTSQERSSPRPSTAAASGNARSSSAVGGTTRASCSPGPVDGFSSRARPSGRVSISRRMEGGLQIHQAKFDPRESALTNATVAREVMKVMLLPRDVEEREKVSVGDILEEVFPHLTHLIHDVAAMRAAVSRYADMSASLQHQLKEAEDKIAGSDRRLRQLSASEDKLKEEVGKLREVSGGLQSTVAEKEAELMKLRRVVADQSAENEGLQKLRELAEKKAQEAEDRRTSAENNRAQELVAAATRAVEEYKNSAKFEQDASEACADFYKFGYSDCIAKAVDAFPGIDIARIALPEGGEEEEEGELPGAGGEEGARAQSSAQRPIVIESPEHAPARE